MPAPSAKMACCALLRCPVTARGAVALAIREPLTMSVILRVLPLPWSLLTRMSCGLAAVVGDPSQALLMSAWGLLSVVRALLCGTAAPMCCWHSILWRRICTETLLNLTASGAQTHQTAQYMSSGLEGQPVALWLRLHAGTSVGDAFEATTEDTEYRDSKEMH